MKLDHLPVSASFKVIALASALVASQLFAQSLSDSVLPQSSSSAPSQSAILSQGDLAGIDGRAFSITPRLTLTETWSDNVALNSGMTGAKESGSITELAPGIRIDARSARLKGYFDYALRGQFYSTPSGYSRTQNQLNTFGTFEAVSNWLFLDFSGMIAQQSISAFGTQSPGSSSLNSNSTETSTYRVSPYIRGQLAGLAEYLVRYNYSTTQANAASVSDIELSEWMGQVRGSTPFQSLRWALDASQQTSDYSRGRTNESERIFGSATYILVPQFRVTLTAGREANNYASAEQISRTTTGYGFDWNPTERTQFSAFKEKRFFGNGHRYSVNHRFPLSSINFSDTKDVSMLPNQFATSGMGTTYEQYRQICSQLLASQYPDPVQLEAKVNECARGLTASAPAVQASSFLSSRATVQRRQQLALAMQGVRNTLTVMLNRTQSDSILASDSLNDDFSQSSTNSIKQRGISIALSHQLSGLTSANLMVSRQESTGAGNASLKATTTLYQGGVSSKLGAKTTGALTVRHSAFDNSSNPYTENAVIGTLSVIF